MVTASAAAARTSAASSPAACRAAAWPHGLGAARALDLRGGLGADGLGLGLGGLGIRCGELLAEDGELVQGGGQPGRSSWVIAARASSRMAATRLIAVVTGRPVVRLPGQLPAGGGTRPARYAGPARP